MAYSSSGEAGDWGVGGDEDLRHPPTGEHHAHTKLYHARKRRKWYSPGPRDT